MPSKDQMNEKAWAWLSDRAKRRATALGAKRSAESSIARSAAYVQDLARRAGVDPEELARRIKPDTLRRLKYPMIQHINEDGTREFKHDLGITEGVKSLLATDRGTEGEYAAPPARDESGRFIKK